MSGSPVQARALAYSLTRTWTLLLLGCALLLGAAGLWQGHSIATAQQHAEQVTVLKEIGRSIAAGVVHAQKLGIPLKEAVGMEAWLAEQATASPLVSGLAVIWASGDVLAVHGMDPASLGALRPPLSDIGIEAGRPWVRIPISSADDARTQAWLHVVGVERTVMAIQMASTLGIALLVAALGGWGMRRWLDRQVHQPLARIQFLLEQMAAGQLVTARVDAALGAGHVLGQLDRDLAWLQMDQLRRHQALLQKLNEVRAAHFDTAVLSRIDALAAPLLSLSLPEPHSEGPVRELRRGWGAWSLDRRFSAGLLIVWGVACAGSGGLLWLHGQERVQVDLAMREKRLEAAFESSLEHTLGPLKPLVGQPMALAVRAHGMDPVHAALPSTALWTSMGLHPGPSSVVDGQEGRPAPIPQTVLDDLALGRRAMRGLWMGTDFQLWVGTAQTLAVDDRGMTTLIAAQPMTVVLQQMASTLGVTVALADHRGQPMTQGQDAVIERWQRQQQQRTWFGLKANPPLVSLALRSYTGHTLGHLVAEVPTDVSPTSVRWPWAWTTLVLLALGFGVWWVRQLLQPLGNVVHKLSALVTEERVTDSSPTGSGIQVDAVQRDIDALNTRLEVLQAMRRSRERQGRRQARFIRHQMLELANRLDDTARTDVLKDLERIEAASGQAPPAAASPAEGRFERLVDEVGVLALGFQNLVGRVGNQYQQLGQMVQELREALRVKTQFIAIQQELEIARKMQMGFLPHDFSNQQGVELHGITCPAREVGGDFYDFFRLDADHLAVLVADVSGKGVPAAFFMAVSRTLMRAVAQFSNSPADCLNRLNDLLATDNDEMMFVTLFYAVIDTRSGRVEFVNAGHNPPYVIRTNGQVEKIPSTGDMALAVMPGLSYQQRSLCLEPGDALYLFTDGVTEATNPQGEWFGESRLEVFLSGAVQRATPDEVNHRLVDAVGQFESGGSQSDDVTCLMARLLSATSRPLNSA